MGAAGAVTWRENAARGNDSNGPQDFNLGPADVVSFDDEDINDGDIVRYEIGLSSDANQLRF